MLWIVFSYMMLVLLIMTWLINLPVIFLTLAQYVLPCSLFCFCFVLFCVVLIVDPGMKGARQEVLRRSCDCNFSCFL